MAHTNITPSKTLAREIDKFIVGYTLAKGYPPTALHLSRDQWGALKNTADSGPYYFKGVLLEGGAS